MNSESLPGVTWLGWLKHLPLRVGALTGAYLTAVMAVSLILANRMPFLDGFAAVRNNVCRALFLLVAMVPAVTFLRRPWHLFKSGLTAWLLFSLAYAAAGQIFDSLFTRLRPPFNVFMIGAMFYGLVAVTAWFVRLVTSMRSHLEHEEGRSLRKAE